MATVGAAEVARLLRSHGIAVQVGSPLLPLAAASVGLGTEGAGPGPLDAPDWAPALAVLADPERQVRVIVPAPAETAIQVFYASAARPEAGLVGCWSEGDRLRLSFPWAEEDLAAIAAHVLQTTTAPPAAGTDLTLSQGGLWALGAAVDALRARLFASLAERRPGVSRRFDRAEILREYEAGLAGDDARWLVTLLRVVAPSSCGVDVEAVEAGLQELAQAGLLRLGEGEWSPEQPLRALVARWRNPLPALAHEVIETSGGGVVRYGHRVAIRGDGPVTVLDFGGMLEGSPRVTVRGADALEYLDGLVGFLRPTGISAPVGAWARVGTAPQVGTTPQAAGAQRPGAAPVPVVNPGPALRPPPPPPPRPPAASPPTPPRVEAAVGTSAAGTAAPGGRTSVAPGTTAPRLPGTGSDRIGLVASAGLVLSALLPWAPGAPLIASLWVPVIGAIPFLGSLRTPASLMVTFDGSMAVLSIGLVMLLVGATAVVSVLVPGTRRYAWVPGAVAVPISVLWLVRLVGFGFASGPWLALAAGTTLLVGCLRYSSTASPRRPTVRG